MRFLTVSINNFRNISSVEINIDAEDIVLTGINGQGKTTFLESIYTLCYGSSFRTNHLKEIIKHGTNGFSLSAVVENDNGVREKLRIIFSDGKRQITIDGKEINDRRNLIYSFPCIVFSHDDILFVKGEPENRRKFFDQMMSLYSPFFFDSLRSYRSILMQRNAAVKQKNKDIIALYNNRLASFGLEIMKERAEAVYGFNSIFPDLFKRISGTDMNISVKYQPSWGAMEDSNEIVEYLEENTDRDIILSTTTSGPHRDRFTVMCDGIPFSSIGSTGQIRLASILFRIAEAEYFSEKTGKNPMLLIDDVLLELDSNKRGLVLESLPSYSQAFYTFLPNESYFSSKRKDVLSYEVVEGAFRNDRS